MDESAQNNNVTQTEAHQTRTPGRIPKFNMPEFSPMYRTSIPVSMNAECAQSVADLIQDTYDPNSGDGTVLLAFARQLANYSVNCRRHDQGMTPIRHRPKHKTSPVVPGSNPGFAQKDSGEESPAPQSSESVNA